MDWVTVVAVVVFKSLHGDDVTITPSDDVTVSFCNLVLLASSVAMEFDSKYSLGKGRFFLGKGQDTLSRLSDKSVYVVTVAGSTIISGLSGPTLRYSSQCITADSTCSDSSSLTEATSTCSETAGVSLSIAISSSGKRIGS